VTPRWVFATLVLLAGELAAPGQSPVQRDCERIGFAAASAVGDRARGATREQLLEVLPSLERSEARSDSSDHRVLKAMHEIVDEVFDYPPLNEAAYMVYKTESCYQAEWNGAAPKPFAEAHDALLACSTLEHRELIACSLRAAGADG